MFCVCAAVRFGKYTPMRSKDKKVQIFVNGKPQQQQAAHAWAGDGVCGTRVMSVQLVLLWSGQHLCGAVCVRRICWQEIIRSVSFQQQHGGCRPAVFDCPATTQHLQ